MRAMMRDTTTIMTGLEQEAGMMGVDITMIRIMIPTTGEVVDMDMAVDAVVVAAGVVEVEEAVVVEEEEALAQLLEKQAIIPQQPLEEKLYPKSQGWEKIPRLLQRKRVHPPWSRLNFLPKSPTLVAEVEAEGVEEGVVVVDGASSLPS